MKNQTILLCLVGCILAIQSLYAQKILPPSEEVWPEYNLFYKFQPDQRFYFMLSGTRDELSSYADGSVGLHYDHFAFRKKHFFNVHPDSTRGYNIWFRGGFLYSTNAETREPFNEYIVLTEANVRYWPFGNFLLTAKSRMDWRWDNDEFEPRFRERLTLETDIQTGYATFTPYVFAEPFFYFNNRQLNRLRLCVGTEFWMFKFLSIEFYYLYQFKNGNSVNSLSAAGIVVKNYFFRKPKEKTPPETGN